MMKTLIASLSIAALAAPAFAQQPTTPAKRQTATEEKFAKHDTNKDGALSIDEVKEGYLEHYGKIMSDEEVERMFAAVDTDGSGFIDYSEFVVAAMNEQQLTTNDKL